MGSLDGDLPFFVEESPGDALYTAPEPEQLVLRTGEFFMRLPPTEAAEVYALGVLLVELMLPGHDTKQVAAAAAAAGRGEPSQIAESCGAEVASLASWLLSEEWKRPTIKMALAHAALQEHNQELQKWAVVAKFEAR